MTLKHGVLGSGLIGSYLGTAMSLQGEDVILIARGVWFSRLQDGLCLSDFHGHLTSVHSVETVKQDSCDSVLFDILWITVKCTAIEKVVSDIAPWIDCRTILICCQNGLDSERPIKQAFPDNPVIRAMVPFNVSLEENNRLHKGTQGAVVIEIPTHEPSLAAIFEFCGKFSSAFVEVELVDDIEPVLWAKLQLNMGNAINALADIPVKSMLKDSGYRRIIAALMDEVLDVASAKAIRFPKLTAVPAGMIPSILRLPSWLFRLVANKMLSIDPEVKTSMWWDVRHGRQSEIGFINGAVVKEGAQAGVPCPVNRAVIDLVKNIEHQMALGNCPDKYDSKTLLERLPL